MLQIYNCTTAPHEWSEGAQNIPPYSSNLTSDTDSFHQNLPQLQPPRLQIRQQVTRNLSLHSATHLTPKTNMASWKVRCNNSDPSGFNTWFAIKIVSLSSTNSGFQISLEPQKSEIVLPTLMLCGFKAAVWLPEELAIQFTPHSPRDG